MRTQQRFEISFANPAVQRTLPLWEPRQQARYLIPQCLRIHWLGEEAVDSRLAHLIANAERSVGGDREHLDWSQQATLPQLHHHLGAVVDWNVEVKDYELDFVIQVHVESAASVGCDCHVVAERLQVVSHQLAAGGVIIDYENAPVVRAQWATPSFSRPVRGLVRKSRTCLPKVLVSIGFDRYPSQPAASTRSRSPAMA